MILAKKSNLPSQITHHQVNKRRKQIAACSFVYLGANFLGGGFGLFAEGLSPPSDVERSQVGLVFDGFSHCFVKQRKHFTMIAFYGVFADMRIVAAATRL